MSKKLNHTKQISLRSRPGIAALALLLFVSFSLGSFSYVLADKYDQKINELQNQNSNTANKVADLGEEAESFNDKIAKLQNDIRAKEAAIAQRQSEIAELKKKITKAEKELEIQKDLLSKTIRAIYVSGDVSTVEMLASSDDLSDFFDKQQYQESIRTKIKSTLDEINKLKRDLNQKKDKAQKLLDEQKAIRSDLLSQKSEQDRLLSLNEAQRAALDSQIKSNNKKIAELRKQQAIENAKHFTGTKVVASGNCGGTYPADAINGFGGHWGCNYPKDNTIDNWGMYNRECVSYTAWRVAASGRHMPYWGGRGNANRWDDNARAAGIAVDSKPRAGDIAIAHWGYYGHSMYVESVNSNGTINISQYNWDYNGTYSVAYNFSAAGLVFIHF